MLFVWWKGTTTMARFWRRLLFRVPPMVVLVGLAMQANCSGQSDDGGPSCSKLCKQGQDECPLLPRVDCDGQCLYEDSRARQTGCEDEVDAVASCSEALDDICTTATACDPELDAFRACLGEYCAKQPTSKYCARE
jgi:hypothetical protein